MTIRIVTFGTSLTNGGGWQSTLQSLIAGYDPVPGETYEVVNRGISGANSARLLRNKAAVVACDPSIILLEPSVNDANKVVSAGGLTLAQSQANVEDLNEYFRTNIPGVKIALMTTAEPRPPNTSIGDIVNWFDMLRYLALGVPGSIGPGYGDWIIDMAAFWWRIGSSLTADGIHWPAATWNTYITPRMAYCLQLKMVAEPLLSVTSPTPPVSWTPLP